MKQLANHSCDFTNTVIIPKQFNEIYSCFQQIKTVDKGVYVANDLNNRVFITLNKKIDPKNRCEYMQIKIVLIPKKLLGKSELEVFEFLSHGELKKKFDLEIMKINEQLPDFDYQVVNRTEYAINVKTPYVKEYIKLFQRSDKSKTFSELHHVTSGKQKQLEGSFYLFNDSVTINS